MPPSILDALDDTATPTGARRCKVGQWLDTIPTTEPGRDRLVAAFETPIPAGTGRRPDTARTLAQLAAICHKLGHPISEKTIAEHRGGSCRCSW